MGLNCFEMYIKTGSNSWSNLILIENFNLNCATIISQTVYAVYWKYEYCIYLNKN